MKKIDFKTKEKILNSVEKLVSAVGSTLGAGGRNVMIQVGGEYAITKDGVTVAKQIEFEDEAENAVAQIVKDAAARTARDAGDGTTTATVIAGQIVNEIMKRDDFESLNVTMVRRGIEEAARAMVASVEKTKMDVKTDEEIKNIATISGNNDEVIGQMMFDVFAKVGKEGAVRLEETTMNKTIIEVADGCHIESGFINPNFMTSTTKRVADYKEPMVFITDKKFENGFDEIVKPLELILKANKPALVICGGMEGEVLGTLINNKMQNRIPVVAVQAPYFGDERMDVLDDIAAATGATVMSEARGFNLNDITEEQLGSADRVVIDAFSTTIFGRHGEEKNIQDRVEYIKNQQEEDRDGSMAFRLKQRMASLTSGFGVIYVGGNSESEMKDMYYRLEDALSATKAAMTSGYVVGGGMAYLNAAQDDHEYPSKNKDFRIGWDAVEVALEEPFKKIVSNSGGSGVSKKVSGNVGYNAVTCEVVDLIEDGIIDPFKVVESAITNAASVASMLITTDVIITDERRKK